VVERHAPRRLYGTRAARYLDLYYGSGSARPAAYLGEVIADLERQDNLPAEVLLTSEVLAAAGSQAQLRRLARYCYADAVPLLLRWDRTAAGDGNCVDLVSYRVRR
jgi:hypothetical protein